VVPPRSDRISRVPPYSRTSTFSTRTGLSPTMARLSRRFRFLRKCHWPGPRSLATTSGVSVDVLSSGYLDVSVRRVCFLHLCIQCRMTHTGRVSPFGNLRIKVCSQLPTAYRNVLRPSSPLSAKASTKCPFALDCKTLCTGTSPAHAVVRKNIFCDLPQTSEGCRSRMTTLNHLNMQSKQTFRINRT
jgi:hypothetical protein